MVVSATTGTGNNPETKVSFSFSVLDTREDTLIPIGSMSDWTPYLPQILAESLLCITHSALFWVVNMGS